MRRRNSKRRSVLPVLFLAACSTQLIGCGDEIIDALGAGALDFLQGSAAGVASFAAFGEDPPSLIFNALLNTIGGGGAGGGH